MHSFSILILLFLFSCVLPSGDSSPVPARTISLRDSLPIPHFPRPERDYPASRVSATQQRNAIKADYNAGRISLDSVGWMFTVILLKEIIPYWYGTPWAFEGHTGTPGQGQIACGYFVSTTLLHAGLNLNRYLLAQQSPADEALMLSLGDTVRAIRRPDAAQALAFWRGNLRDGLYFIGLGASHVGYLFKQGSGLYLIHSNYAPPYQVQLQRAEESVLTGFSEFYLTDITFNRQLMEHWLSGEKVALKKRDASAGIVKWDEN